MGILEWIRCRFLDFLVRKDVSKGETGLDLYFRVVIFVVGVEGGLDG